MTEKQVMIDLNDPRAGKIAEALANNTCKKILGLLSEKEMSATDISNSIKMPINTATYNIDKLVEAGLIEKTSQILWSIKGKQIPKYKLSNKRIVISPRNIGVKGIVPAIVGSLIVTAVVKYFTGNFVSNSSEVINSVETGIANSVQPTMDYASSGAAEIGNKLAASAPSAVDIRAVPEMAGTLAQQINIPEIWAWFLLGSFTAILIFLIWNLITKMKGGS